MKILVADYKGQLGIESVLVLLAEGEDFIATDREELDFSTFAQVTEGITKQGTDWVIKYGAYTQIDKPSTIWPWIVATMVASFAPIALLFRVLGRDPMERKLDDSAQSYRKPSHHMPRDRMEKPF